MPPEPAAAAPAAGNGNGDRAGPPPTREPIISTKALTKTYPGPVEAVKAVDLEVREGEIYGLLGPNGAGKTTTIGMLTTRVVPTSGEAVVGGVDMIRQPALAKQV